MEASYLFTFLLPFVYNGKSEEDVHGQIYTPSFT